MDEYHQKRILPANLKPVYALNVLGYRHFQDDNALRIFELYDPIRNLKMDKELIKIGFFELPKDNVESINQRYWREYFLNAEISDEMPSYIKRAAAIIDYVNLGEEEKEVAIVLEKAEATYEAAIDHSYREGKAEGKAEAAIIIAKNLLQKAISPEMVAESTDLPLSKVLELL